MTHPAVAEAAVLGVPSALGEEEIAAFVVAKAGLQIDAPDAPRPLRGAPGEVQDPERVARPRLVPPHLDQSGREGRLARPPAPPRGERPTRFVRGPLRGPRCPRTGRRRRRAAPVDLRRAGDFQPRPGHDHAARGELVLREQARRATPSPARRCCPACRRPVRRAASPAPTGLPLSLSSHAEELDRLDPLLRSGTVAVIPQSRLTLRSRLSDISSLTLERYFEAIDPSVSPARTLWYVVVTTGGSHSRQRVEAGEHGRSRPGRYLERIDGLRRRVPAQFRIPSFWSVPSRGRAPCRARRAGSRARCRPVS